MNKRKIAHNKCLKCEYEWFDYPGTLANYYKDGCPKCGSIYWKWLNYN